MWYKTINLKNCKTTSPKKIRIIAPESKIINIIDTWLEQISQSLHVFSKIGLDLHPIINLNTNSGSSFEITIFKSY